MLAPLQIRQVRFEKFTVRSGQVRPVGPGQGSRPRCGQDQVQGRQIGWNRSVQGPLQVRSGRRGTALGSALAGPGRGGRPSLQSPVSSTRSNRARSGPVGRGCQSGDGTSLSGSRRAGRPRCSGCGPVRPRRVGQSWARATGSRGTARDR